MRDLCVKYDLSADLDSLDEDTKDTLQSEEASGEGEGLSTEVQKTE